MGNDHVKWKYTDTTNNDYSLQAGSPAIDAGVEVPGWVGPGDYVGSKPDLGAYEYGKPVWRAGADWKESAWSYPPPLTSTLLPRSPVLGGRGVPQLRMGQGVLIINAKMGIPYRILIYNMQDSVVGSRVQAMGGASAVPTKLLPCAIYIIRMTRANRAIAQWKVTIKR
jgi:hypothetical protein